MKLVALIPARAGSQRVPGKNLRELGGIPLIEWTLRAAHESGVFDDVWICSDDVDSIFASVCMSQPTGVIVREPASDTQPDIAWIREVREKALAFRPAFNAFAILRPTSPFRSAATIRAAADSFFHAEVHSLRAVRPATEPPGKQWTINHGTCLVPVLDQKHADGTPWHSSPSQTLPPTYIQTGGLEIAWTYVLDSFGTISGKKILPWILTGYESLDLNTESDFTAARALVDAGQVPLPADRAAPPASAVSGERPDPRRSVDRGSRLRDPVLDPVAASLLRDARD